MKKQLEKLTALAALCKIRISLFAAASAAAGFMLARGKGDVSGVWALSGGVLMLAFGASALNQLEEAKTDALMPRTRARPLPSGRVKPVHALLVSLVLISAGACLLFISGDALPAALGALAVFWYDAVYTFLKRVTAFALLPGALAGAIPPAIGWVYGGGPLLDPKLLLICLFFYIWQVPHFWLFLLKYGVEYESAGLPSVTGIFSAGQLRRMIFAWEVCTAASAMLFAAFETAGPYAFWFYCLPALWMIGSGAAIFTGKNAWHLFAWKSINACALAVTFLLGAGRFSFFR